MRMGPWLLCSVWGLVALLSAGCSHTLSSEVHQQADSTLSLTQMRAAPETYTGRTVVLGGDILSTRNLAEGTLLEVLHKPLDSTDRPLVTDRTEGRFMALCEGYLDPAVYSQGRQVTLAGRVLGSRTEAVGEISYIYPLLSCLEVHLWPPRPSVADYPPLYPYGYWGYPYGYWGPLYYPLWWRHRFGRHFW